MVPTQGAIPEEGEYKKKLYLSTKSQNIYFINFPKFEMFSASGIPEGYRVQFINGFVEELVMNDDPEYQWIDKIRTPRASNEAR